MADFTPSWSYCVERYAEYLTTRGKRMEKAREGARAEITRLAAIVDHLSGDDDERWSSIVGEYIRAIESRSRSVGAVRNRGYSVSQLRRMAFLADGLVAAEQERRAEAAAVVAGGAQ